MRSREDEHFERHAGYPPDDPPKEPDQDNAQVTGPERSEGPVD